LIRVIGGYPEGVCFSILLMNAFTPLIDRHVRPRVYGVKRKSFLSLLLIRESEKWGKN